MSLLPDVMAELWRRGEAWRMLLDRGRPGFPGALRGGQQGWIERWDSHDGDAVNGSGRQRGKTYGKYAMLDRHQRQWPGCITRYCALTIDTADALLRGAMGNPDNDFENGYLATCPANLRPYRDGYDWVYPGGGRMVVMGTDAQTFRRGRGFSKVERDVRDEFCLYQDLDAVEAALNAGTMVPGLSGKPGRCWRASTPAMSSAHPSKLLVDAAKAIGRYELETFYDNPRVDPEVTIRKECERLNMTREELLASTWFRREYMGEWVTEESRAACPAWTDEVAKECTKEWPRPTHFAGHTSHDWGGYENDPHAALFGYVDFKNGKLIIEDEDEVRGVLMDKLCERWKAKEVGLWGERSWDGTLWGAGFFEKHAKTIPDYLKAAVAKTGPTQPFLRVCDWDDNLQAEFITKHGYAMLPTDKHDKHIHVDFFNQGVRERRVIIHPRCRRLLEQMRTTLWDEKRRGWVRTEKDHGDLVDDAVYMWRMACWSFDPFPPPPPDYWGAPAPETKLSELAKAMSGRRR